MILFRIAPLLTLTFVLAVAARAQDETPPSGQEKDPPPAAETPTPAAPYKGPAGPAREGEWPPRARPNINVEVSLPPEYVPAVEFVGFEKRPTLSAMLLHDTDRLGLPQALNTFANPSVLGRQGRTLIEKRDIEYGGYAGYRITLEQKMEGFPDSRVIEILLFGDEEAVCCAQASWMKKRGDADKDQLRAALETIKWKRPAKIDPFAGLTWALDHARTKEFRILKFATSGEEFVIFTDNAKVEWENTGRPILVAQRYPTAIPEEGREEMVRTTLLAVPGLEDLTVDKQEPRTVAGMPAIEIHSTGIEIGTKAPEGEEAESETPPVVDEDDIFGDLPAFEEKGPRRIVLYQLVVFGENEHWVVHGRIWERIGRNWLLEFEKYARSLVRIEATTAPVGDAAPAAEGAK